MKRILATVLVSAFPAIALAQKLNVNDGIGGIFNLAGSFLNKAVPLIISLAIVWFIYNVFMYVVAGKGDEDKQKTAKTNMIWGIVGIFVMVSIWGLVAILQSTLGTANVTGTIGNQLPTIPTN